jgi:hypothetical protein
MMRFRRDGNPQGNPRLRKQPHLSVKPVHWCRSRESNPATLEAVSDSPAKREMALASPANDAEGDAT